MSAIAKSSMKHHPKSATLALGLFAALAVTTDIKCADAPKPEMVENVKKALPEAAPAKPKQARKVLVFSKTNGFRHSSIAIGTEAMKMMGEKTGAFSVTATEDESAFEPANLKQYDGVIFLNTTGECLRPKDMPADEAGKKTATEREEMLKKSLVDFVKGGKGIAGMHAATDTYHNWKEYHEMMGGVFGGHPWHEKVAIKNTDPDNVVNKSFEGKGFDITDEMYQFKPGSFNAADFRVLLTLNKEGTNMDKKGTNGNDALYPVAYLRKYGEGRSFYCSLGHREEIYWNPAVLKHYLAGIQYVLGDLEVDATSNNVTAFVLQDGKFVAKQ